MEMNMENMSKEEMMAKMLELKLQLEQEKSKKKEITLKISEKGAVQINGIRRFPITLYKRELNTLFEMKDKISSFIDENNDKLG